MLRIAYHKIYAHPLPKGHRFPMEKYELIPGQLLHEGSIEPNQLFAPEPCELDTVLLTHQREYVDALLTQQLDAAHVRRIGFPLSPQLVQRELVITQGTIDCCKYALQHGVALNVAGGTHHAFANKGEGFCLLNDMAVAANYLLKHNMAQQILIVDLDVHQGNGTANIFSNDHRVFTFSMHGGHNYPFHKEKSDLDVPLPNGIGDEEYLGLLREHLHELLAQVRPDFVFYLSGVDVLHTDKYGKLNLTMKGCQQRDEMVLYALASNNIPCAIAMGGGYSPDIRHIVEAHCQTFRTAAKAYHL